jgi:hypothetical protein
MELWNDRKPFERLERLERFELEKSDRLEVNPGYR